MCMWWRWALLQCMGVGAGDEWRRIFGSAKRSSGLDMSCRSSNSYWSKLETWTGDVEHELAEEGAWLMTGGDIDERAWYGSVAMVLVVEVWAPEFAAEWGAPAISSRERTMSRSLLVAPPAWPCASTTPVSRWW